jgi:hypothetical protein
LVPCCWAGDLLSKCKSDLIARNFLLEQRRSFSVTRNIRESKTTSSSEVNRMEMEFILRQCSDDPAVG